ncbi:unnamed protein product, partial [Didymodactylos carnosus]
SNEFVIQINDLKMTENDYKALGIVDRNLTWNNFLTVLRTLITIDPTDQDVFDAFIILRTDPNTNKIGIAKIKDLLSVVRKNTDDDDDDVYKEPRYTLRRSFYSIISYSDFKILLQRGIFRQILFSHRCSFKTLDNAIKELPD